jgi:DNA-binding MarR family transcriptional regulator
MPFAVTSMRLIKETVEAEPWSLHVWAWLDASGIDGVKVATQGEIAEALGISRPSVNRAVRWLSDNGHIRAERYGQYETRFVVIVLGE